MTCQELRNKLETIETLTQELITEMNQAKTAADISILMKMKEL